MATSRFRAFAGHIELLQTDEISRSRDPAPWLLRDGLIGELILHRDWQTTPLGPIDTWEACLRSSLSLALASQAPTLISWGPTQLVFYNEAFRAVLGGCTGLFAPFEVAFGADPKLCEAHRNALSGTSSSAADFALGGACFTAYLVPIRDENGAVRGSFMSLLQTPTTSAEPRLLDRVPIPLLVTSGPEHHYELGNEAWNETFGGAPRPEGRLADLYPELATSRLFQLLDEVWESQQPASRVELRLPARSAEGGRSGVFECLLEPLRDASGQPERIAIFATEVTELLAARRDVEESERHRTEFLAMLAHELRNPLAPIRTALHLMKRREPEGLSRHLQILDRQTQNLTHLVDDLLDVSRITRGKIELRRETVDIASLIERSIDAVRSVYARRGIELSVRVPDSPLSVQGDPLRLEQVVVNLLTNAGKYTQPAGHVHVSVTRERAEVEVRVADDGIGIPAELLPRIFNLFQQADQPLDRSAGGLGIGLTLVRSLVELHGGTITAVSPGLGQGSEFIVRLPALERSDVLDPSPSRAGTPHCASTESRVLVVDDNVDAADTLAELLRELGHSVRVCHSGRAALELAAAFLPEAVLLDIGLPEMDGYEVARALRQSSTPPPMLVALTGYGQDSDRERSQGAGFSEHLVKPVRLERLVEVLECCAGSLEPLGPESRHG